MVGEIRDGETADIAIRAALTGHLVFSTLHTNDAVGGITRLLDMGIEPFLLSSTVRAFLAQRLVRTICTHCKAPGGPIHGDAAARDGNFPAEGLGDDVSARHGLRPLPADGLPGAHGDPRDLRDHGPPAQVDRRIKRAATHSSQAASLASGMKTLRHDGWRRVAEGRTTIEEVLRVTQEDEVMSEAEPT